MKTTKLKISRNRRIGITEKIKYAHTALLLLVLIPLICFFIGTADLFADIKYNTGKDTEIKCPFIMPAAGEVIVFFRQEYYDWKKDRIRRHTGIDISGNDNEAVYASGNGVVSYCGISPIGGRTVVIRHNERIRTTYLNLKQVFVQAGTTVRQGQKIATIGADEDPSSDTVHLHFGIIYDEIYLDPMDVIAIDYSDITAFIELLYIKPDFACR